MSLERYVAVCYPLRHAAITTIRNTGLAIFVIWTFSLLNGLIQVSLVDFPELESLQMKEYCSSLTLFVGPLCDTYDRASTCILFVSAGGGGITFSYIGVTLTEDNWGILERLMYSTLTTAPCLIFFYINGIVLFTLRSKTVFCETSRYILLFNLLFADSIQMALSQLLYILGAFMVKLTYPVCGFLNVIGVLTSDISPLTLVVMSLERYVAVCYPLRHVAIITIRNTGLAIFVIWIFRLLNGLIQVSLVDFPEVESLQMKEFCSSLTLFVGPLSDIYDRASTCLLVVSAGGAITFSYIGVTLAAKSASTDKTMAQKARNTLLLHLVQLGLSLSSTLYKPVLTALSRIVKRIVLVGVQNVLYVFLFILPRCLSALIYGIRDQTIRPVLFYRLCCRLTLSVFPAKGYK